MHLLLELAAWCSRPLDTSPVPCPPVVPLPAPQVRSKFIPQGSELDREPTFVDALL